MGRAHCLVLWSHRIGECIFGPSNRKDVEASDKRKTPSDPPNKKIAKGSLQRNGYCIRRQEQDKSRPRWSLEFCRRESVICSGTKHDWIIGFDAIELQRTTTLIVEIRYPLPY